MANVAVLLVLVLVVLYVLSIVRRHRRALVPQRGTGVGADLGGLADAARVKVQAVTRTGPDRVRVVLARDAAPGDPGPTAPSDLDFLVSLRDEDFGSDLLEEWRRSDSSIAIVIPPNSHLVRLRSVDSLQHLTLRRVEDG